MPRGVRYALLALGAVPWLLLLVGQALSLFVLIAVIDDLGTCFEHGGSATAAMLWLAIAPLPIGIAAFAGWRAPGGVLLGLGFPLCVLSVGKEGCPGSVLPFDDSDSGSVPIFGWMLAAYLAVLVCFGLALLLSPRRS